MMELKKPTSCLNFFFPDYYYLRHKWSKANSGDRHPELAVDEDVFWPEMPVNHLLVAPLMKIPWKEHQNFSIRHKFISITLGFINTLTAK